VTNTQLQAVEDNEMKLHRIRTKVLTFKQLLAVVFEEQSWDYQQWLELDLACRVSDDYNDSLTLNKLTCIIPMKKVS
jgi:hypothetical protein